MESYKEKVGAQWFDNAHQPHFEPWRNPKGEFYLPPTGGKGVKGFFTPLPPIGGEKMELISFQVSVNCIEDYFLHD